MVNQSAGPTGPMRSNMKYLPKSIRVVLVLIIAIVTLQILPKVTIIRKIYAQSYCAKKNIGDADCKADTSGKYVNILDYAIWYGESINGCSSTALTGCGSDADTNGSAMDANFNFPGTNYIATDNKVDIFDYSVWIQGFLVDIPTSVSPTIQPTSQPTTTITAMVTPTLQPTDTITTQPTPTVPRGNTNNGIWISTAQVKSRPASGPEWDAMLATAQNASATGAQISNQDSDHDIYTLAMALVCVNQNNAAMCAKARSAVVGAINTEQGGRWLAVGRNLGSYIIAADLLNLHADANPASEGSRVEAWLNRFYTRTLQNNNDPTKQITFRDSAWGSASNSSAQEGFAYTILSLYLNKKEGVDWSWNGFRRYAGDRTSTHYLIANDIGWHLYSSPSHPGPPADTDDPVGIQDAGSTKGGCRLDGAISNDMSRGGTYSCNPGFTPYPWVGLEGVVPAAVVFHRAGYPAFTIANNAILRTHEYLWDVRQRTGNSGWFDGTRANEVIHLVNVAYNKNFLMNTPVAGSGRTVDFTLWTHPISLD
ncbi:hypothetical protein BH09PAT1_BH09PAT1_0930 [soil metagenome]